jgi:hypothetical protein
MQGDTGKITISDTTTIHRDSSVANNQPVVNNQAAPAKPSAPPSSASKKNTAAGTQNNSTAHNGTTGLHWQFGLQWKSAVPLYGTKYYFTGTNTRSEPYNVLIPGIWFSTISGGKHELMLMVKPAEWYYYNNKQVGIDSGYRMGRLGRARVYRHITLVKTGNLYAGLQYNYHINDHWIAGAGIEYHFMGKNLVYQQTYATDTFGLVSDSLYNAKISDTIAGKFFRSSFITAKAEVAYSFGSIDLGATLLMPLTTPLTGKSTNKSRPLNVQIFVRWKIKRSENE